MKQFAHQGDVQIFSVCEIPKDAKKVEKQFIAASERSGSFHALFGDYEMYELENGFIVDCKDECILNHSLESILKQNGISLNDKKVLEKKDHRHTVLPLGKYIFGIQNRFDPMEAIKKRVID